MNLEEMKAKKHEMGLSYERIAELSGLPLGTVRKVFGGITKAPREVTLQALGKVLAPDGTPNMVREALAYGYEKKQGEYTLEDYYTIPEERRVELIDGVIYEMASPTTIHQLLVARIWSLLDQHITEEKGECVPLFSPLDVQLDRDDKTMVQPDVIVICDRGRLRDHIYGEPDLVVEVLSPASGKIDNIIKLKKYSEAGVKEYWVVDPEKKKILVYHFQENDWPVIYGFEDRIPVHIFQKSWELDFSVIYNYIKFMYEK